MPFGNSNHVCGLEIKRLSQLLKNKQKQNEMQTGGLLTSKEVNNCYATSVELCYCYKSKDELVSSDFLFQFIKVKIDLYHTLIRHFRALSDSQGQIHWSLAIDNGRGGSCVQYEVTMTNEYDIWREKVH